MRISDSTVKRMIRAAKLDVNLYEEVEADTSATKEAFIVVLLVAMASGIGSGIAGIGKFGAIGFLWGLLFGIATAIIGWAIWSFLVYFIGTRLLKGPNTSSTWGECLRTIGFANSPGVLRLFSFVPFIGGFISFVVFIWILIASVIAVRQALDFSTGRAIITCLIGWVVYAVIYFVAGVFLLGAGSLF